MLSVFTFIFGTIILGTIHERIVPKRSQTVLLYFKKKFILSLNQYLLYSSFLLSWSSAMGLTVNLKTVQKFSIQV